MEEIGNVYSMKKICMLATHIYTFLEVTNYWRSYFNETLIELIDTQEVTDKTTDKMTDKMTDKNKERVKLVLKYLGQNDSISNKEAQSLLGISEATARRFLNSLVKENLLVAVGEYKARKYIKK